MIRDMFKKTNLKTIYWNTAITISAIPMVLLDKVYAEASISATDLDFITKYDPEKDMFKSVNDVVKSAGNSGYQVVRNVGISIMLISILILALALNIQKQSNKREENKNNLIWYVLSAILFFGSATIIVMASKIAAGIKF